MDGSRYIGRLIVSPKSISKIMQCKVQSDYASWQKYYCITVLDWTEYTVCTVDGVSLFFSSICVPTTNYAQLSLLRETSVGLSELQSAVTTQEWSPAGSPLLPGFKQYQLISPWQIVVNTKTLKMVHVLQLVAKMETLATGR